MDIKKIKQLVKLVEESDVESLRILEDNQEIEITKATKTVVAAAPQQIQVSPVVENSAAPVATAPAAAASNTPASSSDENSNWVAIKSPMVGTFYSSPSPEDPPFVKVGDSIEKGKTVCIVEAMKLFNEIEAEVSGKVVKACVSAGEAVEYGQTLFFVELA